MTAHNKHAPDHYEVQWGAYRKLRNLWLGGFLCFPWAVYIVGILVKKMFGTVTPLVVFAGLWMAFFFVIQGRLSAWRCPRCVGRFSVGWLYDNGILARKCVQCGLPKYAPSDSAAPEQ
jgi:hypothetical protein